MTRPTAGVGPATAKALLDVIAVLSRWPDEQARLVKYAGEPSFEGLVKRDRATTVGL